MDVDAAAAAGAESGWNASVEEQGGISLDDFDIRMAIEASAGGAAAGACAALGAAPAAPLCSYIGAEVTGWAIDNIGEPVLEFFGNLFGGGEPKESLISSTVGQGMWNRIRYPMITAWPDPLFYLGVFSSELDDPWTTEELIELARGWGLDLPGRPGEELPNVWVDGYETVTAEQPLPGGGVDRFELVRPISRPVAGKPVLSPAPAPPNFEAEYLAQYGYPDTDRDELRLREFYWGRVRPWEDHARLTVWPSALRRIENRAIAKEVARRMWAELAALPEADRENLRQWAELAALSPEEQEELRQLAALSPEEQEELRQFAALASLSEADREALRRVHRERVIFGQAPPRDRGAAPAAKRLAATSTAAAAATLLLRMI